MPPPAAFDLLVVGDCNPDLLLVGGDPVPEFGQREQLVDRAAAHDRRLGLDRRLRRRAARPLDGARGGGGRDLFGSHVLEELAARGVDVVALPASRRADRGSRSPWPAATTAPS